MSLSLIKCEEYSEDVSIILIRSEGNDYENFPRSHSEKRRELKPGHPEEFVEMLSSRRGDPNDNQLHKEKLHPLL